MTRSTSCTTKRYLCTCPPACGGGKSADANYNNKEKKHEEGESWSGAELAVLTGAVVMGTINRCT